MYKSILAALDGSSQAPLVLHAAAELAIRTGGVLHVCRIVNVPSGVPVDAWTLTGDQLIARLLEHGTDELTLLVQSHEQRHRPGTSISWGQRVCRLGVPAPVIVELAAELAADLLVVGSRGHNLFERILGTTAARVVNHALCSVLVVRADEGTTP